MSLFPGRFKVLVDFIAGWKINGTQVDATAAELNKLAAANAGATGLGLLRVAKAQYDFATHGGAISAINLNVQLPAKAVVCGGFVEVLTTLASATDAATVALSVEGANDIVSAIAISDGGNPWDAGKHAIVPKANTPESTSVKTTVARNITATVAVEALTAGKFNVWLYYVVSN